MPKAKYTVILARCAEIMMLSHAEFLARVSPAAARVLLKDFKKITGLLASSPFQFPFADEIDVPGLPFEIYRKCLFYGRYKALFLIEGTNVYIDAVIDCRQENENFFNECRF